MYNYRDHAARDEAIRQRCRVTCRNNDKKDGAQKSCRIRCRKKDGRFSRQRASRHGWFFGLFYFLFTIAISKAHTGLYQI